MSIQGAITEDDIANYLAHTPGFFERHAELLATVQLTSPHGGRAVSLQERQMQMLRDKIKQHERQWMGMVRNAQDNEVIADRLHRVVLALLATAAPADLPAALLGALQHEFLIPQAAIRLWGVAPVHADAPWAAEVGDELRQFAAGLQQPFCGLNTGNPAAAWLDDTPPVLSLALVPLRAPGAGAGLAPGAPAGVPFGLLVLGSPDPARYGADMATDFLVRIGELAGAALARLLAPAA